MSHYKETRDIYDLCENQQEEITRLTAENERLIAQLKAQDEQEHVCKECHGLKQVLDGCAGMTTCTACEAAPPLRKGWVSVPRYATQKQINAMAKLDLPNTPYCEIYAAAIAASEEGRNNG